MRSRRFVYLETVAIVFPDVSSIVATEARRRPNCVQLSPCGGREVLLAKGFLSTW